MDKLIYGVQVKRISESGKQKTYIFFVSAKDNKILECIEKGEKTIERIELAKITQINFGNKRGNFSSLNSKTLLKCNSDFCVSIFLNAQSIDLLFSDVNELNQFCFGLSSLWQNEIEEDANL